jgi:hypothetical protein
VYCVIPSIYGFTPWYIAERVCREWLSYDLAGMKTSPTQCTLYVYSLSVTLEARLEIRRVMDNTPALSLNEQENSWLPAFVYLRRAGKQRLWLGASGRGSSSHRFGTDVSGGIWRAVWRLTETAGNSACLGWHKHRMVKSFSCRINAFPVVLECLA